MSCGAFKERGMVKKMQKHVLKKLGCVVIALAVTITSLNVPNFSGSKTKDVQAATKSNVLQSWDFSSGITDWKYGGADWEYQYSGGSNTSIAADDQILKVSLDYSKDSANSWSQLGVCNWNSKGMNLTGANKVTLDFIYDESKLTTGGFTIKAFSNAGINEYVAVDTTKAVTLSGSLKKVPVTLSFNELASADAVNDFSICVIGNNTTYQGNVWIDNVNIISEKESTLVETELKAWTFDKDAQDWYYGAGWEYQYDSAANSGVSYDDGKLKVDVDYTKNTDVSWSQMAACLSDKNGMKLTGANKVSLDFYYDTANMKTGSFIVKAYSNGGVNVYAAVDTEKAEIVKGTLKKATVELSFDAISNNTVNDFSICVIGNQTDYKGSLWLDNIKIISVTDSANEIYVNSTVKSTGGSVKNDIDKKGNLVTYNSKGIAQKENLTTDIKLVDKNATNDVKQIYTYLKAVGESSSAIFGQQSNTHQKAGSSDLSYSDTYDVVGSYSGVIGIDALSLVGNEYSAKRYNAELGADTGAKKLPETAVGNVMAAAALTNYNIKNGAIITMSAHMPNFSIVKESGKYDGTHSYTKYDFTGYSPTNLTGDVMNKILPGGKYNKVYNAYLDMIADYAGMVDGAILFRPFHENTGSWFWWGAAFCDAETYQNIYRYTVEYLRDVKDIHNILYVYGPSSEAASTKEYAQRYPGDDYIDMVGFDMYNSDPTNDNNWINSFENEVSIVEKFATQHNKLFAVTETGVASSSPDTGDNQTALHKSGNKQLDWYQKVLSVVTKSNASYFLVWANFSEKDGFYTPYVKSVNNDGSLYGHEMLDKFIEFYNDPSSIFAVNQKKALEKLSDVKVNAQPTTENAIGYITAPVSGTRILEKIKLTARVTGVKKGSAVKFVLHGKVDKTIQAKSNDSVTYSAVLSTSTLKALGEDVGTIELTVNGKSLNKVNATFNIPEPKEDPYLIDGFENYYGVDSLLTKKWATNKATGNTISISVVKDKHYTGDYSMKFTYNETSDGWSGATVSKEVNWSDCNALQFWTIPDGKNQKVVIQLVANGKVYEVYLNLYKDYQNSKSPMLVTIPFSDFCERDTAGNPKGGLVKDCTSVTSFGLWVNAIADSSAVVNGKVTGTIYYDDITAVDSSNKVATFKIMK